MSSNAEFLSAAAKSKSFTKKPSNEELLELYALYKQATDGDNTESRPVGFDFKAIAKHDAWESKKGMGKDKAMTDYVKFVDQLAGLYQ